jgi:Uma2 family endonuclease
MQFMAIDVLTRKRKPKPETLTFGLESNGILMSLEEFDRADFDYENGRYELVNGVLIVSPTPSEQEADANEELGYLLRHYKEHHPKGKALDKTLPERVVKCAANRRRADRVIWAGLGRLPQRGETPTIIVEFVSSRKRARKRDYESKREDYLAIDVPEYWVIDRFTESMTVHILEEGKYRKKIGSSRQSYRTKLLPGFALPLARLLALAAEWADEPEA